MCIFYTSKYLENFILKISLMSVKIPQIEESVAHKLAESYYFRRAILSTDTNA